MTDIVRQDEDLKEVAYRLYVEGKSHEEIGRRINRHRNTVSKYIREYADSFDSDDMLFRKTVSLARLDKLVDHAFDLLENGDIKDSSLSRPQLMKSVIDATKEANKISGLHVARMHIEHNVGGTLADILLAHHSDIFGADGLVIQDDEEDIEDAEIIEDNDHDILN